MKHQTGCMLCGSELVYANEARAVSCSYCGEEHSTQAACAEGHFVCDGCHAEDGLAVIERICLATEQTDMLALLAEIRSHPAIPMHGPEHHALVPAVIVATFRNLGGNVDDEDIRAVIRRGAKVPGGFCGFAGSCGAALGVGIAFSRLLGATPIKADERQQALKTTQAVLGDLAEVAAARCCQRDSYLALKSAARLSAEMLPVKLCAEAHWACDQWEANKQCLGELCVLKE